MASKTCTTLIINPFSPLQTILESSSTDQSMYDAYASVSDDQAQVVQLISATQPLNSLGTALDNLANKYFILGRSIQSTPASASTSQASIDSGTSHQPGWTICGSLDSSDEDMPKFITDRNPNISSQSTLDTPSSSTNQPILDQVFIPAPQTSHVSPPPTLLLDFIVLKEV